MSFLSYWYYIFVLAVFAVNFVLARRAAKNIQNMFLIFVSYFFYACWDWRFCSILVFSTVLDFFCGRKIAAAGDDRRKKRFLFLSLGGNLLVLGIFKYLNFFVAELSSLLAGIGIGGGEIALSIIMPLGISFYTFQTLSYTIDVFRGTVEPADDFIDYALYVSFFPQLTAGPIERASSFLPQVCAKRAPVTFDDISRGVHLIVLGLFEKLYVAQSCGVLAKNWLSGHGGEIWVGIYGLAVPILCDISGYTDIARGTAKCLGFELSINFRRPYFASNISEFWRRWHMSVTRWFRDYVFFPLLVRNRGRAAVSAIVTLFLIAVWHVLSFNSIFRGFYFGAVVVGYHFLRKRLPQNSKEWLRRPLAFLSGLLTFHIVCVGWLFFVDFSPAQVAGLVSRGVMDFSFAGWGGAIFELLRFSWLFIVFQVIDEWYDSEFWAIGSVWLRVVLYWFVFWLIAGSGFGLDEPFIYYAF